VFSSLSFLTGMAGGCHFALAVGAMTVTATPIEKLGGRFYALDLAGAAGGVLVAAGIFIPIYGVTNTLLLLGAVSGIALLALFRKPAVKTNGSSPN
jgi:hypothetical protein